MTPEQQNEAQALIRALRAAKRDGLTYAQAHNKLAAMPYGGSAVANHDLLAVWDAILPATRPSGIA